MVPHFSELLAEVGIAAKLAVTRAAEWRRIVNCVGAVFGLRDYVMHLHPWLLADDAAEVGLALGI
jgi:hypothetical protein